MEYAHPVWEVSAVAVVWGDHISFHDDPACCFIVKLPRDEARWHEDCPCPGA